MKNNFPLSRSENIVVQEFNDETIVWDLISNRVLCLNHTSSEVWKECDGKNDVAMIAVNLSKKLKTNVSEELVWLSLEGLAKSHLLAKELNNKSPFLNIPRRDAIRQVGLASIIALPLISSVIMPNAVSAQSGPSCATDTDCAVGECCDTVNAVCVPAGSDGCACTGCFECDSRCCMSGICQDNASAACSTSATCGQTLACPIGFTCCNPGSPTNGATCSTCFC